MGSASSMSLRPARRAWPLALGCLAGQDGFQFGQNVFKAWDANAAHIPFLSYFALGDFSDDLCKTLASYYGLPDHQHFYDYLCTLGLLKADGTPRQAWQTFVDAGTALKP